MAGCRLSPSAWYGCNPSRVRSFLRLSSPHLLMLFSIILHALHNPSRMILSIILLALLTLHLFLHLKFVRYIHTPLHRRSLLDRLQPFLQSREWLRVHSCPFGPIDPGEAADICDGVFATYDPAGRLGCETVVEDLVETLGLSLVALDGVVNLFWSVAVEVVGLEEGK